MTTDIESAALAIHAQRRKTFTAGPPPHDIPIEISHRSGAAWVIRFSRFMPVDGIMKIVDGVVGVMNQPGTTPESVAFALAYIQAESDNIELSSGGAS